MEQDHPDAYVVVKEVSTSCRLWCCPF